MAIIGSTDLGDGLLTVSVDHDPTAVATDVPKGSFIIDANGTHYHKQDDGSTTNVTKVIDAGGLIASGEIEKEIGLAKTSGLLDGVVITAHSRNISTIQGDGGVPNTVTVNTTANHDLSTSDIIDVAGTANYDDVDLTITVVSPTQFTYQTSAHTISILESVGTISDKRRFDIAAGEGAISDLTNPLVPVITKVTITAKLAVLDSFLGSAITYLLVNTSDTLVQQTTAPTADQRRTLISIGRIAKVANKILTTVNNPIIGYGLEKTLEDFLVNHGGIAFEGGVLITANGANMKLDNSAGTIISLGRGFNTGLKNRPNTPDVSTQSPIPVGKFTKVFINGSGDLVADAVTNDIDPDNYNNSGTLTPVPTGMYTVQRLFFFPETDILAIYYGPQTHNSISGAQAALMIEDFTEHADTLPGAFRGWAILQEGTADLQDAISNNKGAIIDASTLRPSSAGGTNAQLNAIFGQYSDTTNQKPSVTTPTLVTFDTTDGAFGITHTDGTGTFTFPTAGRYDIKAQPQIERTGSGGDALFHLWPRKGKKSGNITAIG